MQRSIVGTLAAPPGVAVHYRPPAPPLEGGGDWCDVVDLPGDRTGLVVGDCVGRGPDAAAVMGQLRSECRALLLQTSSPAQVVSAMDTFAEGVSGAACTTLLCVVVESTNGLLRYCNAGHPPGLLLGRDNPEAAASNGRLKQLAQPGSLPLGILPGEPRSEILERVPPGALVVLYTDGLIERRGESLDVGIDRLVRALHEAFELNPQQLVHYLPGALLPDGDQEDDVAIVVSREPAPDGGPQFFTSLSARADELAAFRQEFWRWLYTVPGMTVESAADLVVACGEACSNAFEHACGFSPARQVFVQAAASTAVIEVAVRDNGQWKEQPAERAERGRGLRIISGLMDEVQIKTSEFGTTVRFSKGIGSLAPQRSPA